MTHDEAYDLVKKALDEVVPGTSDKVSMTTHLIEDEIMDSLDITSFLFELEQMLGHKIEQIDETFDDYRITKIVEMVESR